MNLVIPMAGEGSRFFEAGYELPKYMLKARGKTLFYYSLISFPLEIIDKVIFIALKKHEIKYNVEKFIKNEMNNYFNDINYEIIFLTKKTEGQAQTVLKAKDIINNNNDLIIYNIDTHFKSKNLKIKLLESKKKKDGIIGGLELNNPEPKWSFAKVNSKNIVTKTAEKEVISNIALTGMYHFTRGADFIETAEHYISNDIKYKNEFYIAPMYNFLIEKNKKFTIDIVDKFVPLGVPEDLEEFRNE